MYGPGDYKPLVTRMVREASARVADRGENAKDEGLFRSFLRLRLALVLGDVTVVPAYCSKRCGP